MRTAYSDMCLIGVDENTPCGINLGYDFCAEHEWGVRGIREHFGVGKAAELGVDARKATKCPDFIRFIDSGKGKAKTIICSTMYRMYSDRPDRIEEFEKNTIKELSHMLSRPNKDGHCISSMWGERDFAFSMIGKGSDFVERLYKAFKESDVCLSLTPASFKGNGLTFVIRSMIDKETEESCMNGDLSQKRLREAVAATGIEERLKDAGCRYFALSPRWKDEAKGEIIYWLNPYDQDKNNCGWMELSDLEDWIKGTGKIPKKK